MAKNTMNKNINKISKAAKKHHGATIAVVAGAALSIVGNATIGVMTVVKAVKNKKATPVADPEPAKKKDDSSNNSPEGDNKQNDDNNNSANK